MAAATSKYRLLSNAFTRPDEDVKVSPKRVVFLSVEGDNTEIDYFKHLNSRLDNSLIRIELLRHKCGDGYSDPEQVIDLLSEYIHVRHGELIPEDSMNILLAKHSKEMIEQYLENVQELTVEQQRNIRDDLLLMGIDLDYRRYLQQYANDGDVFAVIIDRDRGSHSRELMEKCVQFCQDKNYGCYITNPCFEFWLLLHVCDVAHEYTQEQLDEFYRNDRISNKHTKISYEVSSRAHHYKNINEHIFNQYYGSNIQTALARAKHFASDIPELLDQLGTNIPKLFDVLGCQSKVEE